MKPAPGQAQAPPAELFHPVECELCGTHLGELHELLCPICVHHDAAQ